MKYLFEYYAEPQNETGYVKHHIRTKALRDFLHKHFDDKNADKAWNELLQSRKIELRCQDLLNDIEARSNDKLKEIEG